MPFSFIFVFLNQNINPLVKNGALKTVEVRLGVASGAYNEVFGGNLEEGEIIVLNPPAPHQGLPSPF